VRVKRVLITGTTSGVGRALLHRYTQDGIEVISVNRRRVEELESQFPSVRFECADVRSAEAIDQLVRELAASGELPDVFILNAGINRLDNDDRFDLAQYREVVDTNLFGVLNFIGPLTALPAGAAERHLVAVSSMVTYAGNPHGLGYATSKKALTACFEVWSRMYAGTDLLFKQVILGPVSTDIHTMPDRFPRWMVHAKALSSASVEGTGRAIARFAANRKKKLIYPWRALPLFGAMRLGQALIPGFLAGRKPVEARRRRSTSVR
jgi:NAD(P)-dependent dehydrogenase (short-subunit alcohol dehydrogenase family)